MIMEVGMVDWVGGCTEVVHIIIPGEKTCNCGTVSYDEPPIPVDFWELLDAAIEEDDEDLRNL